MMRVEISPTGNFEINLGDGVVHVLPREKALRLAKWILDLAEEDFIEWQQTEVAEEILEDAGFFGDDAG